MHAHCRSFVIPANITTLGTKTATVSLTKPDSNPNNNWDDAVVSPFVTCGQPFGLLAPRPSCGPGNVYVGPDNAILTNSSAFQTTCCVSDNGAFSCSELAVLCADQAVACCACLGLLCARAPFPSSSNMCGNARHAS